MGELNYFIFWYWLSLVFTFIGYPFTHMLFGKWKDGGVAFAKILGLYIPAMLVWFLASVKLLPFHWLSVSIVLILFVYNSIRYISKHNTDFVKNFRYLILYETLFLLSFVIWTYIRGYNSKMEGTEKLMNAAFMNSINRSTYFPPIDPWFSGETINYYYIGHYLYTFWGKAVNIGINYGYNLALTSVISISFVQIISLIVNLSSKVKPAISVPVAIITSFMVNFGGNLHYIAAYLYVTYISKDTLSYFFPWPTRILPYAIDEFPAYSIILGDLHGHYNGIPFMLLAIALMALLVRSKLSRNRSIILIGAISFLIWPFYGISSWDFITTFAFISLIIFFKTIYESENKLGILNWIVAFFYDYLFEGIFVNLYLLIKNHDFDMSKLKNLEKVLKFWKNLIRNFGILIIPGLLFMMPYMFNFKAAVTGTESGIRKYIGIVPEYAISKIDSYNEKTPSSMFVYFYESEAPESEKAWLTFLKGKLTEDTWPWILMWGGFLFPTILYFWTRKFGEPKQKKPITEKYIFLMVGFSALLIFGVEIFFINDLFQAHNAPYYRTNTIFKFYYHAWLFWGVGLGLIVVRWVYLLLKEFTIEVCVNVIIFGMLFFGTVAYLPEGVYDFYPIPKKDTTVPPVWSLDGTNFIKTMPDHMGDFEAIKWINENIKGQPVMFEAVGDAYTYSSRISGFTGLPTVLGWPTHEWQWRGSVKYPDDRKNGINGIPPLNDLISSTDIYQVKKVIDAYKIEYIYWGGVERVKFPNADLTTIKKISDVVYEKDNVTIFKIKDIKL